MKINDDVIKVIIEQAKKDAPSRVADSFWARTMK